MAGNSPKDLIMIPAGDNRHALVSGLAFNGIHEPVLASDAARPETGQRALERLRLPGASERRAPHFLDQVRHPGEYLAVSPGPVAVVLPAAFREMDLQARTKPCPGRYSAAIDLPARISPTDASSRSALTGLLSK